MTAHPATKAGDDVLAPRIAVLIPCRDEAATIAGVVRDFQAALPEASIYVYDNESTDDTAARAAAAGAVVRSERYRGKGNVMRRMFADIEADVYLLADGDGTYDAAAAPAMIRRLAAHGLDLVNGVRIGPADAYRPGHRFGNWLFSRAVALLFGHRTRDVLSGYRALSRRFVKSFPALSQRFEIEVELVVHALELRVPLEEVAVAYRARPHGSRSKLSSVTDGLRIAFKILMLFKETRPLPFFASIGAALALAAIVLAVPLFVTYFETGLVPRLPTGVLATGTMLLAFLFGFAGLVLDSAACGRREAKRLAYLAVAPLGRADPGTARAADAAPPSVARAGQGERRDPSARN